MKTFFSKILFVSIALFFSLSIAPHTYAQNAESQILSVTPPLFQISVLPGDIWQSSIKVVNGNSYPLTVYAEVVNFSATGEAGQGKFTPILDDAKDKSTLASWINLSGGPYVIPPEQTQEVSFFVQVPKDASPGGHYAAILISTEAPKTDGEKLAVKTSQSVTSLFFVRIEGDVHEEGTIREFRVLDSVVPTTNAEFSLRFENKGNVHLQPRGDIVITNMWGATRGTIPVNYQTNFGNVLPSSIRDFKFVWNSDFSISDIGRYKAVVTLAYGEDGIKSTTATEYFWVIPIKATLITLGVLLCFIALIVWMVRLYIRRMLMLAGVDVDKEKSVSRYEDTNVEKPGKEEKVRLAKISYNKVSAPLRDGVLDLRHQLRHSDESSGILRTLWLFAVRYKLFFISVAVLIVIFVTVVRYISRATDENKNYKVIIDEGDVKTTIQK